MSGNKDMADEWVVKDPKGLGRAIAALRRGRGLDQQDLAAQAAIHRSYLSELENGKSTEQTERLFRVIRRLGVDVVLRPKDEG